MSARIPRNPTMILPTGTKIVLREPLAPRDAGGAEPAGAVGVIIKSPVDQRHSYWARSPDESEAPLRRTEASLLKEGQSQAARSVRIAESGACKVRPPTVVPELPGGENSHDERPGLVGLERILLAAIRVGPIV